MPVTLLFYNCTDQLPLKQQLRLKCRRNKSCTIHRRGFERFGYRTRNCYTYATGKKIETPSIPVLNAANGLAGDGLVEVLHENLPRDLVRIVKQMLQPLTN